MPDISAEWNGDFSLTPSGDLAIVDGDDYGRQRILRRLLTAVHGYVFHQDYGAGLPQRIGEPMRLQQLTSIVRSQIALEASVAPDPPAKVEVTEQPGGLFIVEISYTSATTKQQLNLTIVP